MRDARDGSLQLSGGHASGGVAAERRGRSVQRLAPLVLLMVGLLLTACAGQASHLAGTSDTHAAEPAPAVAPAVAAPAPAAAPGAEAVEVAQLTDAMGERASEVYALRVDGADFTPTDHRRLLDQMTGVPKECALDIAREQFRMETNAKYSKDAAAQFLNCHFAGGLAFIDANLMELRAATATNDAERGRLAIAQILHSIQEFYANTNYVEFMTVKYPSSAEDVPILALWTAPAQKEVMELAKRDLFSGEDATLTVSGPSQCKDSRVPRSQLSKTSPDQGAGAQRIRHWNKMTRYDAAMTLALRSSNAFLQWAIVQYPHVLDGCSMVLFPWWK